MLSHYLTIALRNITRNKVYTFINIAGLAIGVASCMLIFLYVQDELSYESHFDKADRIVRVAGELNQGGQTHKFALSAPILAHNLLKDFAELERVTQLVPAGKQTVWYQGKSFSEDKLFFADSSFFDVFSYDLVAGKPASALDEPHTVVLSEEMAQKYFGGTEQAMGQLLRLSNNSYQVTGVFRNQAHSHIPADAFLARSSSQIAPLSEVTQFNHWFNMSLYTYVLLENASQIKPFQEKLKSFAAVHVTPWIKENELNATMDFVLQPLETIHFDTVYGGDITPAGNITYIYLFSAVALFLLLIASINYINLATARSAKRAKEVGLRKVVGAYRSQIIGQFIGESLLITVVAVLLALGLVQSIMPFFNAVTGKQFTPDFYLQKEVLVALLCMVVFIGLVAGSYPAVFLSAFKPIDVLKTDKAPQGGNATLRKTLVVVQFSISLIMIFGTVVVFDQMHFLKNRDLGFQKEQILVIDIPSSDSTLVKRLPSLKNELLRNPNIQQVSNPENIPASLMSNWLIFAEKDAGKVQVNMSTMLVDYDFIETMGIELKEGRNYSRSFQTDLKGALILNEAAAKKLEWQEPIGKRIDVADWEAKVIGVVKDFHVKSLHSDLEPLVLALRPVSSGYLLLRLNPQNMAATISFVESKWRAFDPKHPLEYFFMDDHFDEQYRSEEKMLTIFGYFAMLTILIACLGLFGLASFTAEQRTKEIGIRKVLGGSITDIVVLISKDFALLLLIAIVVASPIAWYGMKWWLNDFAYRIDLSWWVFLAVGFTAMAIALLTVSSQALKAATTDPVRASRTE